MPNSDKKSIVILSFDTLGDLVLRQPLFTSLLDEGYSTTVILRRKYERILPLLDRRLKAITTKIHPYQLGNPEVLNQAKELHQKIADVQPDTLVSAPYNRTYLDDWLVAQFRKSDRVGFFNPALSESPLDPFCATPDQGSIPSSELFTRLVQVAEDREPTTRPLDVLQTILVAAGAGGVLLAIIIGFWLARGAVKPLQEVVGVAAEIEASNLDRRIGARDGPAEVQKLADTFDAMLERLGAAFQQQRNFVLDMSHEVRTPLTALRGNIDVLLMDDRLDGETRSHLERMSGEVARLVRLTSNLLYLAHADAGRELDRRPVDLDLLCLEVYRQTKDLRPEVEFRLGHEDQVTVVGDRDLLKQLILNLVDNSLKYTPAGGKVTLSLHQDGDRARIVVQDTGPGIAPEEIPLIFQRFYRAANSEQRISGGAGIGLAISDWIAKAHGGEIVVESQVGKGSLFTVILPLSSNEIQ